MGMQSTQGVSKWLESFRFELVRIIRSKANQAVVDEYRERFTLLVVELSGVDLTAFSLVELVKLIAQPIYVDPPVEKEKLAIEKNLPPETHPAGTTSVLEVRLGKLGDVIVELYFENGKYIFNLKRKNEKVTE